MSEPEEPQSRRAAKETGTPAADRWGIFRDHQLAWAIAAGVVAFLLLGTGALFLGASNATSEPTAIETPSESPTPEVPQRAVPAVIPTSTPIQTCSVSALAKDDRLATFSGYVTNVDTGEVLFSRDGAVPERTGSVMKLLTASAALQVLGPDYRLMTTVYAGTEPGSIVIVGGGDPTLSRTAAGTQSVYPDAPKLSDLAAQVTATLGAGVPVTSIVLDSSYWDSADKWDDTWDRSEQTTGYLSETTALQVDGDRSDPTKTVSPRSTDPVQAAGVAFAAALGNPALPLSLGTATPGAQELGSVQSQPISSLINTMLLTSDGTLAESLARVTSRVAGGDGTRASLQTVIPAQLKNLGLDVSKVTIHDGSGLSTSNKVAPKFVTQLVKLMLEGKNNLNYVYNSLSIAGETGSLTSRFTGANVIAKGAVFAKTGWIDTEYSLAGLVAAADGSRLAFAFYAIGDDVKDNAKAALDTLTTGIYSCGNNLSNK